MKIVRSLALFAVISSTSSLICPQAVLDKNELVHQTIPGERDCVKADWQFALLAQTVGSLKSESPLTHTCRAVTLSWFPSVQIVQVTGVQHTDVFVSKTFVRANEQSPVRLVTALGGLVENKDRENDEANKTVFNELLSISGYRPTDNEMLDVAALYLFMVGHPPDESWKKLEDVVKVNDIMGFVSTKRGWTTVTVHQRTSPFGNPHREWILKFRTEKAHVKLVSVAPE